jgi:phosphoglycolate phosphatase-like HAD superfamily hydrolase
MKQLLAKFLRDLGYFEGVIFDIEGTLVDSNEAQTFSWMDVLMELGHELSYDRVRPLIGMGGERLLSALTGVTQDSELGQKVLARRWEIFSKDYLPGVEAFPKSKELIAELKSRGLCLGVATSAAPKEREALLKKCGLDELLAPSKVSSGDADASKSSADIVCAALSTMGTAAERTLMIGDTPFDLEAAEKSGVMAIAFRCGGYWKDSEFFRATLVFDGPWEFLEGLRWPRALSL